MEVREKLRTVIRQGGGDVNSLSVQRLIDKLGHDLNKSIDNNWVLSTQNIITLMDHLAAQHEELVNKNIQSQIINRLVNDQDIYQWGEELSYYRLVRARGLISRAEAFIKEKLAGGTNPAVLKNTEYPIDDKGNYILSGEITGSELGKMMAMNPHLPMRFEDIPDTDTKIIIVGDPGREYFTKGKYDKNNNRIELVN